MNRKDLVDDIRIEIENLERLNKEMNDLLEKIGEKPDFVQIRAGASIVHDFYSGVEKIFERIAISIDKNLPKGEDWHKELLLQMAKPLEKIRDAVITEDLSEKLKEYLRFRHLFRHIYGFELKWERFKELCIRLEDTLKELKVEIEKFIDGLEKK
ncbi:MAG: hypothetical protein ACP5OB_07700 [Candidatus Ratteibacteria bacterium]